MQCMYRYRNYKLSLLLTESPPRINLLTLLLLVFILASSENFYWIVL